MNLARWKMLFGATMLLVIGVLAGMIALGNVEQKSSYGLPELIGGLLTLSGGFANWAFGHRPGASDEAEDGRPQEK